MDWVRANLKNVVPTFFKCVKLYESAICYAQKIILVSFVIMIFYP